MPTTTRHIRASAIGASLVLALALAACTTSANMSAGTAPAPGAAPESKPGAAAPGGVRDSGDASVSGQSAQGSAVLPTAGQKIARTAYLQLRVNDIPTGATQVRGIAVGAGGTVTSENISTGQPQPDPQPTPLSGTAATAQPAPPAGPSSAPGIGNELSMPSPGVPVTRTDTGIVTISVPADSLDSVLEQLARLGTVVQRTSNSQDVTSTYVDTQSRIATMTASLDRLRALMVRATDIAQIVVLETELSRREADLESFKARLASLDQRTTMSTVSVVLTTNGTSSPTPPGQGGFLDGLRSGWSAFVGLLGGLLTGLGAALPFVTALAVLALPVFLIWRRRSGPATPDVSEPE